MRQSTRLILNTASTYLRMLVTVGIGLYATRLAVRTLDAEGFGIWAWIGPTVAIIYIFSDGISAAAERFLAFEIARGDPKRLRAMFTTLLGVFVAAALLAVFTGLPAGLALLKTGRFPAERLTDASWAYSLMLVSSAIVILMAPFRSLYAAHQAIAALTVIDTLDSLTKLGAVLATAALFAPGERLVALSALTLGTQAIVALALAALCLRRFDEARPRPALFSGRALRELAHFTTFSVIGNISYRIRIAGPPTILGRFFGPAATGPYGLAAQLGNYQLNIAGAIGRAAQPAVVAAHARGDHSRVRDLISLVNKYSTLLSLYYLVPLMIEAPALLRLWLGEGRVFPHAVEFVRIVLVLMAIPWLYMGYHLAIIAHGTIRAYMLIALFMELVSLAASALVAAYAPGPPWLVSLVGTGFTMLTCCIFVAHISRTIRTPLSLWLTGTWLPVLAVGLPAAGAALALNSLLPEGLWRIIAVTLAYAIVASPLTWRFAMAHDERAHFSRLAAGGLGRLRGRPEPAAS